MLKYVTRASAGSKNAAYAARVAKLCLGYCPRFKARGVNGSLCCTTRGVAAKLNNLSIVICNLSILSTNANL